MSKLSRQTINNIEIIREDDQFYINAYYDVLDKYGDRYLKEISHIPIHLFDIPTTRQEFSIMPRYTETYTDLGFGELQWDEQTTETIRLVYSNARKMTVEEIEEALGHRIEIVSEKGE